MERVLFIDRDGTIIHEPEEDQQVDSYEKLAFLPDVITALKKIAESEKYTLIMITNQDGLGTDSFPENDFWGPHNLMLKILESEGVKFEEIFIDKTFEHEKKETRKPGTAMLTEFLKREIDLKNSYVIGDRKSDLELAENIQCNGIFIGKEKPKNAALSTSYWNKIASFLLKDKRVGKIERNTNETKISVKVDIDGIGYFNIKTGLGFFDHMLEQLSKHSGIDIHIRVKGDLHIDEHHTIEDTALALGAAFKEAIGNKAGMNRYGFLLPMDEALAQVALDFSGRPWLIWEAEFNREKIGDMPTEMFYHFFKSFCDTSGLNLNIKADGDNEHHKIEAIFKGVAKAMKMALMRSESNSVPSTKGVL